MTNFIDALGHILLPKGKGHRGGSAAPPGYNPSRSVMPSSSYRQHLSDLYSRRSNGDSRAILNDLVNHDPDVSAAVHSYLTISAAADLAVYAYDEKGQVDPEGIKAANALLTAVTTTNDYTLGFSAKRSVAALLSDLRYMMLLRGSVGLELVLDKSYAPTELRNVDTASLRWQQPKPGVYTPEQKVTGINDYVDLNIPTFFYGVYHQNPTDMYTFSPFVAAINTIGARTEVITELYRIMKAVGYPRLDITVLEDLLLANAPPAMRTDQAKVREFVRSELNFVRNAINGLQADQAFVHSNAVTATMINDKNPGAGMQIQEVIDVLDSQNQAALKVMPAVVGKSDSATTASTEARLFALSADALNRAVADVLSPCLTFALRLSGYAGRVELVFRPVELRPALELEPQLTMRSSRLKQDLSVGLISDIQYHMEMYGRPPEDGAVALSGTNFLSPTEPEEPNSANTSDTSLGKSLTPEGSRSAKSNTVKRGQTG